MASTEQTIWQFFKNQGFTNAGIAGLMGNMYAESCFSANNLQQSYEKSLGYSDISYTNAVDNGTYTNFVNDSAGYGLCQWTFSSRKQNLLTFAKNKGVSIGDFNMQLEFIMWELNNETEYASVLTLLKSTNSILEASNKVLTGYEKPKNQGATAQSTRASYAQKYYDQLVNGTYTNTNNNIPQINIVQKTSTHNTSSSPNRTLKYIVIHYTAGTHSRSGAAANTASYFASTEVEASADFIVDDENIVQYNPDIKNRRTWHCGGGKQSTYGGTLYQICTNTNSIGVEVCSTSSTGGVPNANDPAWSFTSAVIDQTITLVRYLMATYNISSENVIRHYDVTGKICPGIIGWNGASGDESKWMAFKNRLNSSVITSQDTKSAYAARVVVGTGQVLNCYKEPNETSEIVRTYEKNVVIAIAKEDSGWGYTGAGWVLLNCVRKVSVSEGIIDYILNGYDQLRFDPNSGKIIYPLESWNDYSNGGFKFLAHDDILELLFKIREAEVESASETTLNNKEFAKQIINALESASGGSIEECQEKIRLVLKSAFNSKNSLLSKSSNIVVQTAANALTTVSEEHILEKLQNSKEDIVNYFRETYDEEGWNENIKKAPETLNFWFDFMSTNGEMGKYAVGAIGSRPKAINDDKVTAIYFQETPSVLFLTPEQYKTLTENQEDFNDMTGYTFVQLQPFMENYFTISGQGKSAKDELDSLLYQHTYATDSTTLTAVPIYHLQPNTRVLVKDDNTGINGEFIVSKVTIPLQYNGTTSITTTKAVERIY